MDTHVVTESPRIARLEGLTQELGRSRSLEETLTALQRGLADDDDPFASVLLSTRGLDAGSYRVVRTFVRDGAPGGAGRAPTLDPSARCSGGVLATLVARRAPQWAEGLDWSADPYFHDVLCGYESAIAVPIEGGRLPMDWLLLFRRKPARYTVSDLEQAVERAALVGTLLENQVLASDLARAHARIDDEARQVGELQRALLSASPLCVPGLEIATSYEPASRAGGDMYDFFPLGPSYGGPPGVGDVPDTPSRWCIFIGDVTGHGLAAALVMAMAHAVLRAHPATVVSPAGLLAHANRHLCGRPIGGFLTAFLGVYEPQTRRLTYANAGHPPPLLRRPSDGSIASLDAAGGLPLGIDLEGSIQETTVELEPGSTLLLYTDGITEARDRSDEDPFGEGRLARAMQEAPGTPAAVVDCIRRRVRAHMAYREAADDQTIVAARVL